MKYKPNRNGSTAESFQIAARKLNETRLCFKDGLKGADLNEIFHGRNLQHIENEAEQRKEHDRVWTIVSNALNAVEELEALAVEIFDAGRGQ